MAGNDYLKGPLCQEVDEFLNDAPDRQEDDDVRLLFNWERWTRIVKSARVSRFSSSLSVAQFNSHRILLEVLGGPTADRKLIRDILNFLEERALQPTYLPKALVNTFNIGRTKMDSSIFALFYWEFRLGDLDMPSDLSTLHEARQEAAKYMACARLSRLSFPRLLTEDHTNRPDHDYNASVENPGLTRSHQRGTSFPGASIEPCPWLDKAAPGDELPYFLWDRQMHMTIRVNELTSRPTYAAVSHTWGRWKTDDPPTSLAGTQWPIPNNSRFNVVDIPAILNGIPLKYRYVWMDLVCIPQDHSTLSRIEISRQATIFRSASVAVMWLHDVQEWKGLSGALEWLSLNFMVENTFVQDPAAVLEIQMELKRARHRMELLDSTNEAEGRVVTNPELNPWFTSLWTLQEICLRPDMLLADAHWDLASLGDEPISFDEILSFNDVNVSKRVFERPRCVDHLSALLIYTGLWELLSITRSRLLGLGSQRFCLERRAEAIMSALGATDWFNSYTEDLSEQDLILDQYPVSFIKEVNSKVGPAAFFLSNASGSYLSMNLTKREPSNQYPVVGSMMPFGKNASRVHFDTSGDGEAHPTIFTWTIDADGGVSIRQAAIVSSSSMETEQELQTTIYAPPRDGQTSHVQEQLVDLNEWTRNFLPPRPNYAVCLTYDEKGPTGILLKEVDLGIMVKIGNFLPDTEPVNYEVPDKSWEPPEPQAVEWLVL